MKKKEITLLTLIGIMMVSIMFIQVVFAQVPDSSINVYQSRYISILNFSYDNHSIYIKGFYVNGTTTHLKNVIGLYTPDLFFWGNIEKFYQYRKTHGMLIRNGDNLERSTILVGDYPIRGFFIENDYLFIPFSNYKDKSHYLLTAQKFMDLQLLKFLQNKCPYYYKKIKTTIPLHRLCNPDNIVAWQSPYLKGVLLNKSRDFYLPYAIPNIKPVFLQFSISEIINLAEENKEKILVEKNNDKIIPISAKTVAVISLIPTSSITTIKRGEITYYKFNAYIDKHGIIAGYINNGWVLSYPLYVKREKFHPVAFTEDGKMIHYIAYTEKLLLPFTLSSNKILKITKDKIILKTPILVKNNNDTIVVYGYAETLPDFNNIKKNNDNHFIYYLLFILYVFTLFFIIWVYFYPRKKPLKRLR